MNILEEIAFREKVMTDYDRFLIAEIKETAEYSLTEKFLDENGHEFCEGYRAALEYMAQIIDNFEINN